MAIDTKSVSQLIAEFRKLQAKDAITPGRYRGQVNVLIYAAPCCSSGHGPVPVLSLKKKDCASASLGYDLKGVTLHTLYYSYIITRESSKKETCNHKTKTT